MLTFQLSAELDPFCDPNADCGLCYVRAEGSNDAVHHFWATFGAPAMLSVHTSPTARLLNVSWDSLRKRELSVATFNFSEPPIASSAVVLSKLWEYKDVNNTAKVDPGSANGTHYISLGDLVWGDIGGCEGNGSEVVVATFTANSSTLHEDLVYFSKNGVIQITVSLTPRSACSKIIQIIYVTSSSRFVFRYLSTALPRKPSGVCHPYLWCYFGLSRSAPSGARRQTRLKTIHDQVAPSVFNVAVVPGSNALSSLPTYLHWKPVSYRDSKQTVTLSVDATDHGLTHGADWWLFNVATAWMSNRTPNVSSTALNWTLGSEGDGHYKKYGYATWSVSAGFGDVPVEQVSTTVIAVTSVGLGIPGIVAIVTVGYLALYKPEPSL
ncbi:unnamed protein product [Ixodes hexagonus]